MSLLGNFLWVYKVKQQYQHGVKTNDIIVEQSRISTYHDKNHNMHARIPSLTLAYPTGCKEEPDKHTAHHKPAPRYTKPFELLKWYDSAKSNPQRFILRKYTLH